MVAIHETAYPRFRSRTTFKNLDDSSWEPSTEEIDWVKQQVRKPLHRQVLLTMFKAFQHLGYHITFDDIPTGFIQYYGKIMNSRCKIKEVRQHGASSVRNKYIRELRAYLKVKPHVRKITQHWAEEAALTRHYIADIINVILEKLVKESYELPGFTLLEKIAIDGRSKINRKLYSSFLSSLSEESAEVIESFLKEEAWERLKYDPGKLTTQNSADTMARLKWMCDQQSKLPALPEMTPEKLQALKLQACSMNRSEMSDLKKGKRELLLAILLRYRLSKTLDDATNIHQKTLRNMHRRGNEKLKNWLNEKRKQQEKLISQLKDVTLAYQQESNDDQQKLKKIGRALKNNPQKVIDSCNQLLTYSDNNYLPFMVSLFRNHRASLFEAINLFDLKTACKDYDLIKAIKFIKKHRKSRKSHLDFTDNPISLDWVPAHNWWPLVTGTMKKGEPVKTVNRIYLEMCVFTLLAEALESCDMFVENSDHYGDFRQQFMSEKEFQEQYVEYCDMIGFPSEAKAFCQQLKTSLYAACKKTDEQFPDNAEVKIDKKMLVISPIRAKPKSMDLKKIETLLQERMPNINILDLLTKTEQWLKLSKHIRPLSGNRSRMDDIKERFILNLLCYGCNLGSTQIAKSVQNFNRKQISRLNLKYTSEENLSLCIKDVVNAYNRFLLPGYWGTGKSVSADGTRWDVYENNLLSEYHIRYGSYGGIGYYHVSDKYIALFSRFIPCGIYEAIYILDALIENDSDIQPDTIHSDTHGQNLAVFGLAYMLGIKLMPRIKNIKKLNFYRPEAGVKFKHINPLFSESIQFSS